MNFYQALLADRVVGAVAGAPGRGWSQVPSLAAMIATAQAAGLPLVLLPGTYPSPQIDIAATGNPLTIGAEAGSVIIKLQTSAPYLLGVSGTGRVTLRGLVFDGAHLALTDRSATAALLKFEGAGLEHFVIERCTIRNSSKAGVACLEGAAGEITGNHFSHCNMGIFCIDAHVHIERNDIGPCDNNGVLIWTNAPGESRSTVCYNTIHEIASKAGGTGQNGNGINVYRASSVQICNNHIGFCTYSAIRVNAASDCNVSGNYCAHSGETAIWFEAPGAGTFLTGGICANNIITSAGSGIAVANAGLYNDGTSRRVAITGNQISGIMSTYVPAEGQFTSGFGITMEGGCVATGNMIDGASHGGILLGTNNAATDIVATGNAIHACPLGIGYSANPAAAGLLISGNEISGYAQNSNPSSPSYAHSGAIVSVSFDGAKLARDAPGGSANVDYGNAAPTTVGALTLGLNKAR